MSSVCGLWIRARSTVKENIASCPGFHEIRDVPAIETQQFAILLGVLLTNPNHVIRSLFDKDVVFVLRTPLQVEPI
jgi:hypothetical protein